MAGESKVPVKTGSRGGMTEWRPFETLRREIDRMFDDVAGGFWRSPFRTMLAEPSGRSELPWVSAPPVDVVEKEGEYQITAELPGLEQKDIQVSCTGSTLTIKGEKKEEKEEKHKDYYLSERHFGAFQRAFSIPQDVDAGKIDAKFKNGVLTLTLPKTAEAKKNEKKIEVKAG